MTSEEKNYISEQPGATCPAIDEVKSIEKEYTNHFKGYHKLDEDELKDLIKDFDSYWWHFSDDCEKIRKNVEAIRSWGEEWKQLALEKICEVNLLEIELKRLEKFSEESP